MTVTPTLTLTLTPTLTLTLTLATPPTPTLTLTRLAAALPKPPWNDTPASKWGESPRACFKREYEEAIRPALEIIREARQADQPASPTRLVQAQSSVS